MSDLEPSGMFDMTGWQQITCNESDVVMACHRNTPFNRFGVASSLTDPDGIYGSPVIFTEWWFDDRPLLREYRDRAGGTNCRHYKAVDNTAAREVES